MGDFCRFFHIRTIPLAFRNANIYIYLFALTSALSLENRHHPCLLMNALPVSHSHYPLPRTTLASTRKRVRFCCSVKPSQLWWGLLPICTINEIFRTIPLAFRRVSVCVCLVGFASLQSHWAHTLRHPCLACPSRCIDPLHFYNLCKRTLITCLARPSRCT